MTHKTLTPTNEILKYISVIYYKSIIYNCTSCVQRNKVKIDRFDPQKNSVRGDAK